jgi:hypothetical protein
VGGIKMKRIILLLSLLLTLLLAVPVHAGADWQEIGTVTNLVSVKSIDYPDYYRVNFDFKDNKGTTSYTVLCPLELVPAEIMYVEANSKYQIRMNFINGEWFVSKFNLIQEIDKTVKPPIKMNTYTMPKGVYYNRDAVGEDWIVYVDFGLNTPRFEITANAVKYLTGETTLDAISDRVSKQSQLIMEDWNQTSQIPSVLSPTQRVETLANKTYLVDTLIYFGFHLYALDNPLTPENELSYTTIISVYPLPDIWW